MQFALVCKPQLRFPPLHALLSLLAILLLPLTTFGQPLKTTPGNRLAYLDDLDPYYPHAKFPKLITPQWVGEEGVEAVVILAIDDMKDPQKIREISCGPFSIA